MIWGTTASTGGTREDILDLVTQVSPEETPFLSRLGTSKAGYVYHEWITDALHYSAGSGDSCVEGTSATPYALYDKTRYYNYTNISDRVFAISGTEEETTHVGVDSEYSYRLEMAMKELKIKMERLLLGGSALSAGGTSYGRTMAGAFYYGVNYGVCALSGVASTSALTETKYNDLVEDVYDAGGNPNTTYVNGYLKRRISSFATPNNRTINMTPDNGRLGGVIDFYTSDFGTQEIVLDRHIKGLANGELGAGLIIDQSKFRVAYLRKPFTNPLGVDGDRRRVQILTEYCLEALAPTQIGIMSGMATASV